MNSKGNIVKAYNIFIKELAEDANIRIISIIVGN